MRIYTADDLETLRTRTFLAHARADGFLTQQQYLQLEQETPSDLRTTNIFLRIVLFLFTALCAAAAGGLFFVAFQPKAPISSAALFFLAAACYAAAEFAVREARFYHHGIEEALAVSSIVYLLLALESAFLNTVGNQRLPASFTGACCAALSLWIWVRFGLWYTFLLAMAFTVMLPTGFTASPTLHRVIIATLYAAGILTLAAIRTRHPANPLDSTHSLAEALLWLGTYFTLNLKVFALQLPMLPWLAGASSPPVGTSFYWTTWLLTWLLPPILLLRAIRLKDRLLLTAGIVTLLLTLLTNKPYLGWPVHTWDPMVLGIVLTAAALLLRRWLQQGPAGIRHGFTAARLSQQHTDWLATGASTLGLIPIHSIIPTPPSPTLGLEGGASGGAGATRDF